VCATLSTLKGGSYSTRSLMSHSQASDQWAYFQAKSIKGYLYDLQKEKLELELKSLKLPPSSVQAEYEKKIAGYSQKVKIYDAEKGEIQKKAEGLELLRDELQQHSAAFGVAAMFLQIGILLSSIAALMKKKYFWLIGVAVGCIGMLYFANGFWHFMN
ncbi:MAG: DUF4337 domain-containing protein, partial [Syntrophales bacterium LBB04]|nr:DUF4337 domain-containing protein [Syntrophales bacterium LBB04]